jgi:hypothetical protein
MIAHYFQFLKTVASTDPSVKNVRLIKERIGVKTGYIRFALELRDGSELHVFEYVTSSMHKLDYSYHWQDKEQNLVMRWDNAPHHPEVATHPHHLHDRGVVKPAHEPTLAEILKTIGDSM